MFSQIFLDPIADFENNKEPEKKQHDSEQNMIKIQVVK
jgi:hypothetical protein